MKSGITVLEMILCLIIVSILSMMVLISTSYSTNLVNSFKEETDSFNELSEMFTFLVTLTNIKDKEIKRDENNFYILVNDENYLTYQDNVLSSKELKDNIKLYYWKIESYKIIDKLIIFNICWNEIEKEIVLRWSV